MKAREAAAAARWRLEAAGVADAAFEAEYLVRAAAGISRAEFFLDRPLEAHGTVALAAAVERRSTREPAPYITGEREFWGRPFAVGPGVLVPRPETELLVEIAVRETRAMHRVLAPIVADIGTGSGCVAVSIALEVSANVVATDVSSVALGFARANAARFAAPVRFLLGDLATALGCADVVLANLPYIASEEIVALEPEVSRWEPRVALDGGGDGFDLIRQLVTDCAARLRPRLLALEVGFGMAATARAIAEQAGASVNIVEDFAGIDRIICCRWR